MTQTQPPFGARAGNGSDRRPGEHASADELALQLRDTLTEAEARLRELVRSYPVPAVLGALALGYVLARWVRRP